MHKTTYMSDISKSPTYLACYRCHQLGVWSVVDSVIMTRMICQNM